MTKNLQYHAIALVTFGAIEFVIHFNDGVLPVYISLSVSLIATLMSKLNNEGESREP